MPSCSSARADAQAVAFGMADLTGTPRVAKSLLQASRTGTRIPSGTRALVASVALPNAPAHATPSKLAIRSSTLAVRPAPPSALTTIDRVPEESIDVTTACSAPTVLPVVSKTVAHIPATIAMLTSDATGWARAVASDSRTTARRRLITRLFCRNARRAPDHVSRQSRTLPKLLDPEMPQPRHSRMQDPGFRSARRPA